MSMTSCELVLDCKVVIGYKSIAEFNLKHDECYITTIHSHLLKKLDLELTVDTSLNTICCLGLSINCHGSTKRGLQVRGCNFSSEINMKCETIFWKSPHDGDQSHLPSYEKNMCSLNLRNGYSGKLQSSSL